MATDISLIVTDLDGTLWDVDHTVHPRTVAALATVERHGIPVLVATGRRIRSTRTPLAALGVAPPAVVLNGALGLDLRTGERFHHGGYEPADAVAVLEMFLAHGVHPCVHVDHDDRPVWVSTTPSTHPGHIASFRTDVTTGDLLAIVSTHHVLGFGVLGLPRDVAEPLGDDLARLAAPHVDRDREWGGYTIMVGPAAQSKWKGVLAYCDAAGIDPDTVAALGDGPNDAELLAAAALAVVPADAHPAARRHAHHVVGRAADGGWAELLDLLDLT